MEKSENKVDHGKRIDLALSRNTQFSWKNEMDIVQFVLIIQVEMNILWKKQE